MSESFTTTSPHPTPSKPSSTSRYYHSRVPKSTAPLRPSAFAASTSSPALLLHKSKGSADGPQDEDEAPEASFSSAARATPLPSFMGGVRVFFYNLPASERKRLSRYLITYPFSPRLAGRYSSIVLVGLLHKSSPTTDYRSLLKNPIFFDYFVSSEINY